jgi:signal transduction histidine kinase
VEDLRPRTTLFCAVIAFAIALSMLLRGRRAVHWLFAAFATDVAFWYGSQSLADLFKDSAWVRVTAVVTVLLPQFAVHLFESIVPPADKERPSRLPRVATIVGVPMLALELSPYNDTSVSLGLAYVYVFGLLAAALISLARRGQQNPSRAVRDRVRFLFVVGVLATTFTLADFVSFLGGPVRHLPPIGAVLATVFLFVLAESLTRPRLADLYDMAGRLLVSTALAFCLAGIFYVFVKYVGRFNTYLNAVLAAIVILVLFEPLQTEVETRIHRFFFRERYDLETAVTELRRHLSHVLEIDEMVETLLGGLERSHRATSVAIFLRDQDGDGFDLVGSIGVSPPLRLEALATRPLLERLGTQPAISLEEVLRERKDTDTALLASSTALGPLQGSVLLGVKADDEELVGLICVADDRVRDAFTPEEVTLLETVASQIGVAIANSRVYSRMKERDRLAALGAMAAGLAHEVKNPLGAIKGAAQLLEELDGAVQHDPSSRDFIGIILEEVNRLDRVVGSFLDYARPHAGNPIPLDINAAVRRTTQILASQRTDDEVDVKLELTEPLTRVKIDPEQFRQVLINLMQNAIQAMDGRGRVTVSTSLRRLARAPWASGPQGERGGAQRNDSGSSSSLARRSQPEEAVELVEISVKDTGPGISQKVKNYLFIPFFTTKEKGTGLGLAISQSIVQSAGGTIDVQSQAGAGTTFTIVLPSAVDTLSTPAPAEVLARESVAPSRPA